MARVPWKSGCRSLRTKDLLRASNYSKGDGKVKQPHRISVERSGMTRALILVVCSIVFPITAAAEEDTPPILVGDPAPSIRDVRWLRGEQIQSWKTGEVYVIDFWATWCPPCIDGLRRLQTLHTRLAPLGVHFIAVAVWPTPTSRPPEDVLVRFPELAYSLAIDNDDATADALMTASRSSGLPTTMIIDRSGRLAWVGAPSEGFEEALQTVLAEDFDIESARRADIIRHRAEGFIGAASKAERSGEFRSAIDLIDRAVAVDPDRFSAYRGWQYEIALLRLEDPRTAKEIAERLLSGPQGGDPYALFILATRIVSNFESTPPDLRDLDLALHCARKAIENSHAPDYEVLALVAEIHALRGKYDLALQRQSEAMSLASESDRSSAERALEDYRLQAATSRD